MKRFVAIIILAMVASTAAENAPRLQAVQGPAAADITGPFFVNAILPLPDNRVIIGGSFSGIHGVDSPGLIELSADATTAAAFDEAPPGPVSALARAADGTLIVAGGFGDIDTVTRRYILKYNPQNQRITGFPGANWIKTLVGTGGAAFGDVNGVLALDDGAVLLAGNVRDEETLGAVLSGGLVKVEPSGASGWLTFVPRHPAAPGNLTGFNQPVAALARTSDGLVAAGGWFTTLGGQPTRGFALLGANGLSQRANDPFDPGWTATVDAVAATDHGRIFVAGSFRFTEAPGTTWVFATLKNNGDFDPDGPRVAATQFGSFIGPDNTLQGAIAAILPQPDGGALLATTRLTIANGGLTSRGVVRVLPDGALATAASDPGGNPQADVRAAALAPDGSVWLGGAFDSFDGDSVIRRLVRLYPGGGAPLRFNPSHQGTVFSMNAAVPLPGGGAAFAGEFSDFRGQGVAATGSTHFAILDPLGRPLPGAATGHPNGPVTALARTADGRFFAAGSFNTWQAQAAPGFAKVGGNGSLDATLLPNFTGTNGLITALLPLPGGGLVIAGDFTTANGQPAPGIAWLEADGSLKSGFLSGGNFRLASAITAPGLIGLGPNESLFVAGAFDEAGGSPAPGIAKFNADGTRDLTFNPGTGANGVIHAIAPVPGGGVLVGGSFSQFNQSLVQNLVMLFSSGAIDTAYTAATTANGPVLDVLTRGDRGAWFSGDFSAAFGAASPGVARAAVLGGVGHAPPPATASVSGGTATLHMDPLGAPVASAPLFIADNHPAQSRTHERMVRFDPPGVTRNALEVAPSGRRFTWRRSAHLSALSGVRFFLSADGGQSWSLLPGTLTLDGATGSPSLLLPPAHILPVAPVLDVRAEGIAANGSRHPWVERAQLRFRADLAPIERWRLANFGTIANSGAAADTANPSGDGYANLVKYAFRLNAPDGAANPHTGAAPVAYTLGPTKGAITFALNAEVPDISFVIEASNDLATWSAIAAGPAGGPIQALPFIGPEATVSQFFNTVTVTDRITRADAPVRFLRLRVQHNP